MRAFLLTQGKRDDPTLRFLPLRQADELDGFSGDSHWLVHAEFVRDRWHVQPGRRYSQHQRWYELRPVPVSNSQDWLFEGRSFGRLIEPGLQERP